MGVNKIIAVKEENGGFIEAQYEGEYAGCRYDIEAILFRWFYPINNTNKPIGQKENP